MSNSAFYFNIIIITIAVLGAVGSIEAVPHHHCHQNEKQALLNFKHDLTDPTGRLSSWVPGGSCCNWRGVVCDNLTGQVLELQLRGHFSSVEGEDSLLGGPIPEGITNLTALMSFNLSGNSLTEKIPDGMGSMSALEALDLSLNRLSGKIPQSMANMTFLSFLNLSFNDLTGRIPTSTQLQSFDASSYIGNKLCGPPVSTNCGPKESDPKEKLGDNKHHGLEYADFYVSMSVGFIVGLGAVIAPLLYSNWWRDYFFHWLQNMWDRLWECTTILFRK